LLADRSWWEAEGADNVSNKCTFINVSNSDEVLDVTFPQWTKINWKCWALHV